MRTKILLGVAATALATGGLLVAADSSSAYNSTPWSYYDCQAYFWNDWEDDTAGTSSEWVCGTAQLKVRYTAGGQYYTSAVITGNRYGVITPQPIPQLVGSYHFLTSVMTSYYWLPW